MNALQIRENPHSKSVYHCQDCVSEFPSFGHSLAQKVSCPSCGSRDRSQVITIYQEDDPDLYQMYTKIDWRAGD
ncbi:MAG: hypothetical protein K8F91_19895 [Candidatus Obscuribacterales bacterium]|nr:hypothetical protein [Candidatus Obscuribacterales bacterium]